MKIDPETYRDAAFEHVSLARELYDAGRYVYALYVSGVSVECLLRSRMDGGEFSSRHDLADLLRESRFLETIPPRHAGTVAAALGRVWARWRNTHRYCSTARLKKFVIDRGLHRGVRGDPVKESARVAVESAFILVNRGAAPWAPPR